MSTSSKTKTAHTFPDAPMKALFKEEGIERTTKEVSPLFNSLMEFFGRRVVDGLLQLDIKPGKTKDDNNVPARKIKPEHVAMLYPDYKEDIMKAQTHNVVRISPDEDDEEAGTKAKNESSKDSSKDEKKKKPKAQMVFFAHSPTVKFIREMIPEDSPYTFTEAGATAVHIVMEKLMRSLARDAAIMLSIPNKTKPRKTLAHRELSAVAYFTYRIPMSS